MALIWPNAAISYLGIWIEEFVVALNSVLCVTQMHMFELKVNE